MTVRDLEKASLVAVWPGISGVAIGAGYYLLSKLGMTLESEFSPRELFEVSHIDVEDGLIHLGAMPHSRLFVWRDPRGLRDIVLFVGDAQPPTGKYAFCSRLVDRAAELGVERVFTFAAMATDMKPGTPCRVFGAATDESGLQRLDELHITRLTSGRIGGLNGVLLAASAERGLPGTCLLGETPHIFPNIIFPRASLAVLQAFTALTGIQVDLDELSTQAEHVDEKLKRTASEIEGAMQALERTAADEATEPEPSVSPDDRRRIEELFDAAASDRARAYELKGYLDHVGLFDEYEDRFLDLFRGNPD